MYNIPDGFVERTGASWLSVPGAVEIDRWHVVWDGGRDCVVCAVPAAAAAAEDARRAQCADASAAAEQRRAAWWAEHADAWARGDHVPPLG